MTYDELKEIVERYGFTIEELGPHSHFGPDVYIYAPDNNCFHHTVNEDSSINRVWATASVSTNENIDSLHLYLKLRKIRNGGMYFDGCSEKVVYELSEKLIKRKCVSILKKIKKMQSNFKMNKIKDMF